MIQSFNPRVSRMWITVIVAAGVILLYVAASRVRSPRLLPIAGSAAPEFSLSSQDGQVSLQEFRGKWVVLYFYPKDMTSGCTVEARNFQRDLQEYARRNAVVLGVSVDNTESHRQFCARDNLQFKLLADTSGEVSRAYGSLMNFGLTKISARNTFLIGPKGRIARTFARVNPSGHSAEVLAALDELEKPQLELQ
jgi:thioredoxin-dependent peroxiredoxin